MRINNIWSKFDNFKREKIWTCSFSRVLSLKTYLTTETTTQDKKRRLRCLLVRVKARRRVSMMGKARNLADSENSWSKYYISIREDVFCKQGVLKNFAEFLGKHLSQSLFFNKVAGLRPATSLKERLRYRCFSLNFAKFLRTPCCRTSMVAASVIFRATIV